MSEPVQWYYARNGEKFGPLTPAQLKQAAMDGTLRRDDLLWRQGFDNWRPAGQAKGLFPAMDAAASATPAPRPAVQNQPREAFVAQVPVTYAGFWKRFLAVFLDWLVLLIPTAVVGFLVGIVFAVGGAESSTLESVGRLFGALIAWLYFALMESSAMQGTLGKKALGIKVTDQNGERISFGKATGRHFGKIISALIFGVGFIMAAFTQKKQALHDMMASCLVVNRA